jgi:RHS repeat-associated protein
MTTSPHLIVQDLRLPGQEYDSDTGLYHNGFRNYIPGWGRYLESDPIGLAGGLNTYAYASGNPLNAIDPYGLRDNLIFEPPGSYHEKTFLATPSRSDMYLVGGDANPQGLGDLFGNRISPQTLANMIRSDPAYYPGEPVRLDACRLGLGTYAQELSNELNALVWAADNYVWSGDPRGPIIAPKLDPNDPHSLADLEHPGHWIIFKPQNGDFDQTIPPIL